ncbi:MAG: hypothetical protein CK529_00145 [Rhodospirillaceae bacterium]|nr:MAG: hypothetical protein CK529_00145 [Rhodospirillaceae bacterium]
MVKKTAEVNINLGRAERYILGFSALWFTINSFLPFAISKWTPEAAIYVGFIQIGAFAITLFFILALPAAADEMENPITLKWKIEYGSWLQKFLGCFLPAPCRPSSSCGFCRRL